MDLSDQALLEAYRKGNAEALATLVERYRRALFSYIYGMMGGQTEADEVFQEVWFRAIRRAEAFHEGNLVGWLVRIAHNLIIDRGRRKKPEISLDADWSEDGSGCTGGMELAARQQDVTQILAARELGEKIAAAVAKLPHVQREVFLMRTQMQMPFREIARAQKTSINTALARMHYALGKLRPMLQDEYREMSGKGVAPAAAPEPLPRKAS